MPREVGLFLVLPARSALAAAAAAAVLACLPLPQVTSLVPEPVAQGRSIRKGESHHRAEGAHSFPAPDRGLRCRVTACLDVLVSHNCTQLGLGSDLMSL